jgi:hypothetical protein
MTTRGSVGLTVAVMLGVSVSLASAQPSVPVKQVPPGFTVTSSRADSTSVVLEATRPNAIKPAIAIDASVHLGFSWQPSPGFELIIDIMANSPQDPASDMGGTRSEPAGKSRFRGGVLTFEKRTVLQIGTNAEPWVTYRGVWMTAIDGGALAISVTNYAGPKEHIQPWIEAMIPAGIGK